MLFNSMTFVVFFATVGVAYFLAPHRWRWLLLLVASYYFYMSWNPKYALLIVTSTVIDYVCGLALARTSDRARRRALLGMSLMANLGLLFTFKYANFALDTVRSVASVLGQPLEIPHVDVLLPVGISFYTFQTLSYTIEVYRGRVPPERHFGRFALFVALFPQLVAGPIERARDLLPQLRARQSFDVTRILEGLQLMAWGLFKKLVIADRLAMYVDAIYAAPELHSGPDFVVASYFFAFQLYCDFSGYSDIAIGSAKVLGFKLTQNFRLPFLSTTTPEFWQRWHITLLSWFRDYIYLPLVLRYRRAIGIYLSTLLVMFVSGLWHGAAWTFVLWGLSQGILISLSRLTLARRDRVYASLGVPAPVVRTIRTLITFHLFTFTLILFRAQSLGDAAYIFGHLFRDWPQLQIFGMPMVHGGLGILLLVGVQLVQLRRPVQPLLNAQPLLVRWVVYYAVIYSIVVFGVDSGAQFIYFQF